MADDDWGGDDAGGGAGGDWGAGADPGGPVGGDSVTETSSENWFSRVGKAILAIPVGLILFALSFVLLFWNEGRAVHTARGLTEGKASVVSIDPARVDPTDEAKLIHATGEATADETLKDPLFVVSTRALRLRRVVQMYQWREKTQTQTRTKVGGGQQRTTTYTYERAWSTGPIDSSRFHNPGGHQNPANWPFANRDARASRVTLGAFQLSTSLVDQIEGHESLPVGPAEFDLLPDGLRGTFKLDGGRFYRGDDPAQPRIGDMMVSFEAVRPQVVSLLARQVGSEFEPFVTQAGTTIERLQAGTASASEMFLQAEAENRTFTWVFRLVGFLVMAIGLVIVLSPLSVLADVVPFLGGIVGLGVGFVAFGVASVLSLATIALGWIVYRPWVGIALLAVAGLVLFGFFKLARARRQSRLARV